MCPVKLANEMSDLSGTFDISMTRCGGEAIESSRSEAGTERRLLTLIIRQGYYQLPSGTER